MAVILSQLSSGTISFVLRQAHLALEHGQFDEIEEKFAAVAGMLKNLEEENQTEVRDLLEKFYKHKVVHLENLTHHELRIHQVCVQILKNLSSSQQALLFQSLSSKSQLGLQLLRGEVELENCFVQDRLNLEQAAQNLQLQQLLSESPAAFVTLLGRFLRNHPTPFTLRFGDNGYVIQPPLSQFLLDRVIKGHFPPNDIFKKFIFVCADTPVTLPFILVRNHSGVSEVLHNLTQGIFREAQEASSNLDFERAIFIHLLDHLALESAQLPAWHENILECYDCAQFFQIESLLIKYEELLIHAIASGQFDQDSEIDLLNLILPTNRAEFKDKLLREWVKKLRSCKLLEEFDELFQALINKCPTLDFVILDQLPLLNKRHLECLTQLTALKYLTLRGCSNIQSLPRLGPIQRLDLHRCDKLTDLEQFCSSAPFIRTLEIERCRANQRWTVLRHLTQLRELTLSDCFISHLSLPPSLQVIRINGGFLPGAMIYVSQIPALPITSLSLPGCAFEIKYLNALLAKCKGTLRILDLSRCPAINQQTIQFISESAYLEELMLEECTICEENIVRIILAKNLKIKKVPPNWLALLK